jgi:hypothetical protein
MGPVSGWEDGWVHPVSRFLYVNLRRQRRRRDRRIAWGSNVGGVIGTWGSRPRLNICRRFAAIQEIGFMNDLSRYSRKAAATYGVNNGLIQNVWFLPVED